MKWPLPALHLGAITGPRANDLVVKLDQATRQLPLGTVQSPQGKNLVLLHCADKAHSTRPPRASSECSKTCPMRSGQVDLHQEVAAFARGSVAMCLIGGEKHSGSGRNFVRLVVDSQEQHS